MGTAELIMMGIETAAKDYPEIATALRNIFTKANPTAADWAQERANIHNDSYANLVPNSDIPAGQ